MQAARLWHSIADSVHVKVAVNEQEEAADGGEPVVCKVWNALIGVFEKGKGYTSY